MSSPPRPDYPDYAGNAVRDDLVAAQVALLDHLRSPGSWFSGAERVALARESRAALQCGLCAERKAALSPYAVQGDHDALSDLPPVLVDVVHRVRTDPGRLSRKWFDEVRGEVEEGAYVDAVGVVTLLAGIDHFCRALGVAPFALPDPAPGEPTRYRPEGLSDQGAWVAMLAPEDCRGPEEDLFGEDRFVPNIVRALSQTPDHVRALRAVSAAHYIPLAGLVDTNVERELDRFQIELVAARVSALNECFYWTTAHAALLRASGEARDREIDLAAVNGAAEGDGGVDHGARLVAFTEAVMGSDDAALARERAALQAVLTSGQFIDTCAVIGSFNVVDRIADATGIPLDPIMREPSAAVREELDLNRFAAAANTPGAR